MKNVADIYPLTPTQAGILYHSLQSPENDLYYQQISCTIRGGLDVDRFKRAWEVVVQRHPALRTIFLWEGVDEPLQVVRQTVKVPWEIIDLRGRSRQHQEQRIAAVGRGYRERGFDLTQAPILRMVLVQLANEEFHFYWNFHHLLTDGWSTHLVFNQAMVFYEADVRGEALNLTPVRPFRDYIDWLKRQDMQAAEDFWRAQLAGFEAPTPLPMDHPAGAALIQHGETSLALSPASTQALRAAAQQHRVTLNTVVQGAWALLLSRYSDEQDVVFGATLSGRPADLRGVEDMVGMFINTLPVRVRVAEEARLLPWLEHLQALQLELRGFEYSPLAQVQSWNDTPGGQALFDSIVVFENYPTASIDERSVEVANLHYREQSNYPLALLVMPDQQLRLLAIYDQARFDAQTVDRMLDHLRTLLSAIAADPDRRLMDLPMLDAAEYEQIVVSWNDTEAALGPSVWLQDRIAAVAGEVPSKTAVIAADAALTYGQLDQLSNQLAHHLIGQGIQPGTPVGLHVERSTTMIVGIIGILKAGCPYVPLDPAYPVQRIAFILEDSGAPVVITEPHLTLPHGATERKSIVLDDSWSALMNEPRQAPLVKIDAADLAYIIYTSGSTGKPKGVMVTHENLFHSTAARRKYYSDSVGKYLLLSSFAFDSSVAGIFWTLADGGALVLPRSGEEGDIAQLSSLIAHEGVTHTLAVPSLYRLLLEYADPGSLNSLRTVIVAGEAFPTELISQHYAKLPDAALYNEYGPTEATVWASVQRLSRDSDQGPISIGRPIANTRLYVLDRGGQPVPVGVPGELVISGPGVVPGYWQQPELSAERFAPVAFHDRPVYRTGDRVRWLPDSTLEFLGRADDQLKIRGFRVEPGEIEHALRQNDGLRDALVIADQDRLIAYLIAENGPGDNELRQAVEGGMARQLPEYMVPSSWLWLDEFPRTPNGKIDRRNLPKPDPVSSRAGADFVNPETDTELDIQSIWRELLGVEKIGALDDFFELGGHSLLLTQLVSRLRQTFDVAFPLSALVDARTIREQSKRIDTLRWSADSLPTSDQPGLSAAPREEFEL